MSELCSCITLLYPTNSTAIILGDFNFPRINWSVDNCSKCDTHTCSGIFLEFYYNLGLYQFVNKPTRYDNILDLVFCNDINGIINLDVHDPFSSSDHCRITFDVVCNTFSYKRVHSYRDFKCADWSGIRAYLNQCDFYELLNINVCAPERINGFFNVLLECIDLHVPIKTYSSTSRKQKYPIGIRNKLHKKATAWRVYKQGRTPVALAKYKKLSHECRSAIRTYIEHREEQLINNNNLGAFYRYANNKFCSKSQIGALKDNNGSLTNNPARKAELLQSTFASNFTIDDGILPSSINANSNKNSLNNVIFTTGGVRRAINKLKVKTKGGPDGIPPSFLKACRDELCYPLSIIFTLSLDNNYLPDDWLKAFISPLFKKGNSADPSNYRPIALTSTICKLMESIIKDQILSYLLSKGLISKKTTCFYC